VWAYGAIQVSRKVLRLKSVRATPHPLTSLGTNMSPWRILFTLLAFSV